MVPVAHVLSRLMRNAITKFPQHASHDMLIYFHVQRYFMLVAIMLNSPCPPPSAIIVIGFALSMDSVGMYTVAWVSRIASIASA